MVHYLSITIPMNKNYKYLLLAGMLCNLGDNLIGPFYSVYVHNRGIELVDIGYASVIYSFVLAALMYYVGKASDTFNKKAVTVLGYTLFAFSSLLYLVISESWHLFAMQIINALGSACLAAPLSALMTEYIQKDKSGEQWGLLNGIGRVAVGFSVLLGTLVVKYFDFTTLFFLMFVIQISATFVQAFLFKEKKQQMETAGSI